MLEINLRHLTELSADTKLDQAINSAYYNKADCLKVIHGNGDTLKKLTKEVAKRYDFAEYSDTYITEIYQSGISYIKFSK